MGKIVGAFLKEAREKQNLSQWDVARQRGWSSPQFVSNMERGISDIPEGEIPVLLKILKARTTEFLAAFQEEQTIKFNKRMKRIKDALK